MMASIRKEITAEVGADLAWSVLRQMDQAHKAFAPVLTDCRIEGDARIVTFANGMAARELIVDVDDDARRMVYAVVDGVPVHHTSSFEVFAESDGRCRIVWITDVLPHSFLDVAGPLIEAGSAALRRNLEALRD